MNNDAVDSQITYLHLLENKSNIVNQPLIFLFDIKSSSENQIFKIKLETEIFEIYFQMGIIDIKSETESHCFRFGIKECSKFEMVIVL